jgi:hypothetical protein
VQLNHEVVCEIGETIADVHQHHLGKHKSILRSLLDEESLGGGADSSGYLDSIPHPELMKSLARRISDGRVLRLIKMWVEAAMEETDEKGNRHRTTRNKDQGMGTPQGSPISPLLSNIYMRRFI